MAHICHLSVVGARRTCLQPSFTPRLRELFHEARSQTLQSHYFFDEIGRVRAQNMYLGLFDLIIIGNNHELMGQN